MTEPYYADESVTLHHGDCLDVLRSLPDNSVDSVVTDPPYGLGFMGREWDNLPPGLPFAQECLRVLKPGGHLVAFGGSRTWHRLAVAVEDAGFEIRDSIAWLYGSGFPKSLDVSKAIDKARDDRSEVVRVTSWLKEQAAAAGVTRADVDAALGTSDMGGWWLTDLRHRCQVPKWEQWEQLRALIGFGDDMDAEVWRLNGRKGTPGNERPDRVVTDIGGNAVFQPTQAVVHAGTPILDAAQQWQGWGTALKPAFEPIVVGRKPFPGTVAGNILEHGTGALNIDGCRIAASAEDVAIQRNRTGGVMGADLGRSIYGEASRRPAGNDAGRWPTNVVLDESQAAELDKQTGVLTSGSHKASHGRVTAGGNGTTHGAMAGVTGPENEANSGGASRFFPVFKYQAKAPTKERPKVDGVAHPTVKPLELMRWLVRLVTPPGGTVLEPFAGSGTTAEACLLEGVQCIAIEREADYLPLIVARLTKHTQAALDFGGAA